MLRSLYLSGLLLLAGAPLAHAERTCDIDKRFENLRDNEKLVVTGRIVKSYGRDKYGDYSYDLADSCGQVYIGHDKPITCRGQITINGEFDEDVSLDYFDIAIWVTSYRCH
mgnify:CR=1 FL=1